MKTATQWVMEFKSAQRSIYKASAYEIHPQVKLEELVEAVRAELRAAIAAELRKQSVVARQLAGDRATGILLDHVADLVDCFGADVRMEEPPKIINSRFRCCDIASATHGEKHRGGCPQDKP